MRHTKIGKEKLYHVLLSPVVTEKTTRVSEHNQVVFDVANTATKPEIKQAVEEIFKVKVDAVNTTVLKGKTKRFRGVMGKRSDRKRAYVSLAEGSSIDMASGV